MHRLGERRLRLRFVAAHELQVSDADSRADSLRSGGRRRPHLRDRAVEIFEPRQSVAHQNHGIDVRRGSRDDLARKDLCFLELAEQQAIFPGLHQSGIALRQEIGGAHELTGGAGDIAGAFVGFSQPQSRIAEFRILLQRVAIVDDRVVVFLLREVRVAGVEMLPLRRLGRAAGANGGREERPADYG